MNFKDNRFYLQALGITALFILMLLVIWIGSGGPASEAAIRNSSSTRTAIAATEMYLMKPFPTNTPLFLLPTSMPPTNVPGSTPTIPPVLSPNNTSMPPLTNTPIPSIAPSPTQTTVTLVPTAATSILSHQPTKAPPLVPLTGMDVQDASGFVYWYFDRVWKERDYRNLWDNYLTPSFKAHVGSGLFEDYVAWWNSVERADVNAVDVIQNNGTSAWVRVNLTIRMKDGHVLPNQIFDYDLLYDAARRTWMFDYSP